MGLINKIFKIANIKADEILNERNKNKSSSNKSNANLSSYDASNERIEKLRKSIQNTKQ